MSDLAKVRFWGVRGSLPTPGRTTVRYGGNTSCVEMHLGEKRLIFDAGSGIAALGTHAGNDNAPVSVDLAFSHLHYDHICGLPFFAPLFQAGNEVRIWSRDLTGGVTTEAILRSSMTAPVMPDMARRIHAGVSYHGFAAGSTVDLGAGVTARTALLHHPGGSVGYRIEWSGRSIVYATDTGHGDPAADAALRQLCRGADMVIYDAMLTDEEFPSRANWGHSTWREGVRLANDCGVGKLVLFHHAPSRDDKAVAALEREAAAARPGTVAAREGLELTIRP